MLQRRKKSYSLKTRLVVVERLKTGENATSLAKELNIPLTTILNWRKTVSSTDDQFGGSSSSYLENRRSLKRPDFYNLDKALFQWYNEERERGTPLSGPIIQEKARELNVKLGGNPSFLASNGWLSLWKKRHEVQKTKIRREMSCEVVSVEMYKKELHDTIASLNLMRNQIYNCKETGLNYRMLPSKTTYKTEQQASGYKVSKDHVTLVMCSNACGTNKLPLMVVGKSREPRTLKNHKMDSLPVLYRDQKNSLMNLNLFKEWFHQQFVPAVMDFSRTEGIPPKALLIVDNASSHPKEPDFISGDIHIVFLPPDITALVQPMEQGILNSVKYNYRKKFLKFLITGGKNEPILDKIKKITMKEVISWAADSWDMITGYAIRRSWKNLLSEIGHLCETPPTEIDQIADLAKQVPGYEQMEATEIREWLSSDCDTVHEILMKDEIVSQVLQRDLCTYQSEQASFPNFIHSEQSDSLCTSMAEEASSSEMMSHAEGLEALECAFQYVSQESSGTPVNLIDYKLWRDYAVSLVS